METIQQDIDTYAGLNINQRINVKGNSIVLDHRMNLKYITRRHPLMWGYRRLLLEQPFIHNNRNYDGPEPDYNAPTQAEIREQLARCQREIK